MKFLKLHLLLSFLVYSNILFPQEYATGVLLDPAGYAKAPVHAPLMRGDYINLPKSVSLKKYCPTPRSQGMLGTCAGWSTAYACRTIVDAIKNNWTQPAIDSNAYSPSFVYNQLRKEKDCQEGIFLTDALGLLVEKGILPLNEFEYICEKEVTKENLEKANGNRLIEYRMIVDRSYNNKTTNVKKSLAENKPVVIAMDCCDSFFKSGDLFKPDSSDYFFQGRGHGVAVVAYDDSLYGGSFQIMNSWGTNWGKDGFTWIRYSDFDFFCLMAFEVIGKPVVDSLTPDLSGSILFKEPSAGIMKANFNGKYFEMERPYPSGTFFDLRFSNDQPAYVYVFSWDLTNKAYKIFPFTDRMVAYLPYHQNNIAIPDEESYNILDTIPGQTYFCFLYSLQKLDLEMIMHSVEKEKGDFDDRVRRVLGDIGVDPANTKFTPGDNLRFSAFSRGKKVLPIIIKITQL
ncbi:MAG: hypothetical protein M0P61_15200 [Ignavibacteriaceae bacterium]|nr:hypothetical protein [Ignavibacteriaceae bacterium]